MTHNKTAHRVLYIDCFSGIAGDMMLGALLDLDEKCSQAIHESLATLEDLGFRLSEGEVSRQGIGARQVNVEVDEARQPGRSYSDIEQLLRERPLDSAVVDRALRIFRLLAEAEGHIHRKPPKKVHFHEVGAVDSIVDIVGVAAGLEHLKAKICSSQVPLGRGFVKCRHGTIPLPAPATLALLRNIPVYGTSIEAELVTPTGAAILASEVSSFGPLPAMIPQRTGWGAGTREHPDRPGLLRLVLGESYRAEKNPTCVVLEANIDDMTPEIAAYCIEKLLDEGALDAWITPITMKKGRPAMQLGVLARKEQQGLLAAAILRETTSIGLRFYEVGRVELQREMTSVETPYGPIAVKLSSDGQGLRNVAPEFEACRNAAQQHGIPLKTVVASALCAALQKG